MHPHLSSAELTAENLEGVQLYGPVDVEHPVGKVSHLQGTGAAAKVIVDVGGFLGIGAKPVALDVAELEFRRDDTGTVYGRTSLSKDELEQLPEHR